jgi:hypothetical protein
VQQIVKAYEAFTAAGGRGGAGKGGGS